MTRNQDMDAAFEAGFQPTEPGAPIADDDGHPKRAPTAGVSTPHDAVLAELQNAYPGISLSAKLENKTIPDVPGGGAIIGDDSVEEEHALGRTYMPEELREPFTGATLGLIGPGVFQPGMKEFSLRNQDMWTNLSKVLELQSEIAKLHVDMEGITAKGGAGQGPTGGSKMSWDLDNNKMTFRQDTLPAGKSGFKTVVIADNETGADGDAEDMDVGVEEDEEVVKKKAREAEFANLAIKFEGRKAKVDAIMDKLGDLSKAITEFHGLQTPMIAFPAPQSDPGTSAEPSQTSQVPLRAPEVDNRDPNTSDDHDQTSPPRAWAVARERDAKKSLVLGGLHSAHHPGLSDSPKSMGSLLIPDE